MNATIKNMYSTILVSASINVIINLYASYQITCVKKELNGKNIRLNAMYDLIYELTTRR